MQWTQYCTKCKYVLMATKRVLISGAGVAGTTLAYWLGVEGFDVTVVEKADDERSSGNPVDVRGDALRVVESMGIADNLRAAATTTTRTMIVNDRGATVARLATQNSPSAPGGTPEIEIPRADLAATLLQAASSRSELRRGVTIKSLHQDEDGVEVRLSSGEEQRFDFVFGADGVRSNTRQLAFRPDSVKRSHLGLFVATTRTPMLETSADEVLLYSAPGRMVSIHPGRGEPMVAFFFRAPEKVWAGSGNRVSQKLVIQDEFRGLGWRVPELLDHVRASSDVFFDSVTRVQVRTWANGRVAVVGDAASCVSLLGNGSSNAIVGAHALAKHLSASSDHRVAFRRYQAEHKKRIVSRPMVLASSRFLVPRTSSGVHIRNQGLRLMNLLGR